MWSQKQSYQHSVKPQLLMGMYPISEVSSTDHQCLFLNSVNRYRWVDRHLACYIYFSMWIINREKDFLMCFPNLKNTHTHTQFYGLNSTSNSICQIKYQTLPWTTWEVDITIPWKRRNWHPFLLIEREGIDLSDLYGNLCIRIYW